MAGKMYNRRMAWWITGILVAAGLLIGSHRSFMALRATVEDYFLTGEGSGCIQQSLEARAAAAYNMATVAKRNLPEGDAAIEAVLSARDALLTASDIGAKSVLDASLDDAVAQLSQKLAQAGLNDTDEALRYKVLANFQAQSVIISHDPYHEMVAGYNRKLKVFPANLLSKLVLAKPLEPFGSRR